MPLGLAKDSMLNLAELASKVDDDEEPNDISATKGNKFGSASSDETILTSREIHEAHEEKRVDESHHHNDIAIIETVEAPMHMRIDSVEIESPEFLSNLSSDSRQGVTLKKFKAAIRSESKVASNNHRYAGFQEDYYDIENYTSYNFPGNDIVLNDINMKNDESNCWECIFPWFSSENDHAIMEVTSSRKEDLTRNEGEVLPTNIIGSDDDEVSMISTRSNNFMGEKESKFDSKVVSPRLRVSQPDAVKEDGAGDNSTADEISSLKRSILKHSLKAADYNSISVQSNGSNSTQTQQNQRRSLFPAYESKSIKKKNLSTSFSPMARVVTIKSCKDMNIEEKSNIWWQKPDYDEFRKTGRIISKAMLQGGSEIWLATNQSWQLPNQGKAATLRRAIENVNNEDTNDKWWHKFGHSRRGLEHIATIDEGRQRQANVKISRKAILAEQRRQKTFQREDPEKLRMCSIQNTSWAKDLSLASGASDADAVTKNFDDESRKSREFYLLKFSRAGKLNSTSSTKNGIKQIVPAFMKPIISMELRPNLFDANTTSRLQFKKKEDKVSSSYRRAKSVVARGNLTTKPTASLPSHNLASTSSGRESLASRAAGFANGEKPMSMSAVLTGMGPLPKSSDATHSRPVLA